MTQRILVLGATGAMGQYLVPSLAKKGYQIDTVALNDAPWTFPNVTHVKADAKDQAFFLELMSRKYDAMVDFMTYPTSQIAAYLPLALKNVGQYIFLSSCRVYADLEHPIKESSPRLIDVSDDPWLLASDDYCIYKARAENALRASGFNHWTIVRPATTFSHKRFQLVTLEAALTVRRAREGKPVVVPIEAKDKHATLSWGGDVAEMISGLVFNPKAMAEDFNVCSSEHHTWGEIAEYYYDICNLNAVWVPKEDYYNILGAHEFNPGLRWQLEYARLFQRISDNSKVLAATGLKQENFRTLYDGLKHEIQRFPEQSNMQEWPKSATYDRMDNYLKARKL